MKEIKYDVVIIVKLEWQIKIVTIYIVYIHTHTCIFKICNITQIVTEIQMLLYTSYFYLLKLPILVKTYAVLIFIIL